jgi:hypothetical protein
MKTALTFLVIAGLILSCAGCAIPSARSTPLHAGFFYASMKYSGDYPENAKNATPGPKRGGITKLHTVDHEFVNVLCVYQKYTTVVTGE